MPTTQDIKNILEEYGSVLIEDDNQSKYSLTGEGHNASPLLKHTRCPFCGSSDAGAVYRKNFYCFSCNQSLQFKGKEQREAFVVEKLNGSGDSNETEEKGNKTMSKKKVSQASYKYSNIGDYSRVNERGLTKSTCEQFLIRTVKNKSTGRPKGHIFGYCIQDADTSAWQETCAKLRSLKDKNKMFWNNKPAKGSGQVVGLFGQHAFPAGSAKAITITEGEWDAASASQMSGGFPAVSIPDGAGVRGVLDALKPHLEYLSSFSEIVINFDNDEHGVKAAEKAAELLTLGTESTIKILRLSPTVKGKEGRFKDANDYLVSGLKDEYVKQWWRAEKFTPEFLVSGNSLRQRIFERRRTKGFPYPWKGINEITHGQRPGELILWAAQRGVGKSTTLRQIALHALQHDPNVKVGTLFLEESPEESGLKTLSIYANKNLHTREDVDFDDEDDDGSLTEEQIAEIDKAFDECLRDERMFFYDFTKGERGTTLDKIKSRIRYYAIGLGCNIIILDHVGIVASASGRSDAGELDKIAQELARLATELNITIHMAAHINREGRVRGSDGPENSAHIVFHLYRDVKGDDEGLDNEEGKYFTIVHCTKQRNIGENAGRKIVLKCNPGEQALVESSFEELPVKDDKTSTEDELDSIMSKI